MQAIISLVHSVGSRLTLWLVGRHGVPFVLAGTLTLAVIGSAATRQPPSTAQSRHATIQTSTATTLQPSPDYDDSVVYP
jgi:hypothetical protein